MPTGLNAKGCPACRGAVDYPHDFYSTDAYKQEQYKKKKDEFDKYINNYTPQKMSQEDFDMIVIDLCTVWWADSQAHGWVGQLVQHILATDDSMKLPTTIREEL